MTVEAFEKIPAKKRVLKQKTLVIDREPVFVRTEWEGRDMSRGEASVPMIYATYVLSQTRPNMCFATPNKEKALVGHEMMVGLVRGQGAKSGPAVIMTSLARAFTRPQNIRHGWWMMGIFGFVVAIQLAMLTLSALTWNWDWSDLFTGACAAAYGYCVVRTAQAQKRLLAERKEKRRLEDEQKTFENIIGPLR